MADISPARSRGRPVQSAAQVAKMRARIAAQALALFQAEGYGGVSMRRIADATGCTVVTLYRYYPRKIDILRHLWRLVFDQLFDELDGIAAGCDDPGERLQAVALGYVAFWLAHRDHYFMVFLSSHVDQADVSIFVQDDAALARFGIFAHCLAAALALPPDGPAVAIKAQSLLCSLNGIAHNLITISAFPWAEPAVLVRAAMHGLLAAPNPVS